MNATKLPKVHIFALKVAEIRKYRAPVQRRFAAFPVIYGVF